MNAVYEQVKDRIVDQSASRLNDAIQKEMKFLARMGWDDSEAYNTITSAVEFLLSHPD